MPDLSYRITATALLAINFACHETSIHSSSPIPAMVGSCQITLPIQSEDQAICRVRELSRAETMLAEDETIYSATLVGDVWRVSVIPSKATDIGGGYIVEINAESGEIVTN